VLLATSNLAAPALSLVAVLVGAITATTAAWLTTRVGRRAATDLDRGASLATLEERLDELSKSMRNSARLVEQVSAELDARAATARQLQQEAETAEALAALHKDCLLYHI
jgi:hypothetical protein